MKTLAVFALLFLQPAMAATELHEYSSHSYPIEIRNMFTISDYRLSQALGSCLIKYGGDGTVTAQLADRWKVSPDAIEFHIRPEAKWSDGSKITAADVAASFAYILTYNRDTHSDELSGFSSVEILAPDRIRFNTKPGVAPLSLLPKLTEPSLGIVRVSNGKADLHISSGPYALASDNGKETLLSANRHWVSYKPEMIDLIRLRRSPANMTPLLLAQDKWPDLVYLGTGVMKSELAQLPANTPIWRLNHDRILAMDWTGRGGNLAAARVLIGYLRAQIAKLSTIGSLLDESLPAPQIYPMGNVLHGDTDPKPSTVTREEFLHAWKFKDVRIAYVEDRMHPEMAKAAEKILRDILPVKLKFIPVKSKDTNKMELSHTNDLFFASLTVDPDDIDGDLSGLIETEPIQIPSDKSEMGNFRARLKVARSSKDPLTLFRRMLVDAVEGNYYLPVIGFSSAVVGRPNLDFSQLPKFGDIVPYSAMRLLHNKSDTLMGSNQ